MKMTEICPLPIEMGHKKIVAIGGLLDFMFLGLSYLSYSPTQFLNPLL